MGDKTVEYRSVEELKLAIREVRHGLAEQAVGTGWWPRAPRQVRIHTHKAS